MANSDKNLTIRPRINETANPVIEFVGADASTGPQTITAEVTPANQGTITFSGTSGTILTISDNATNKLDVNGNTRIDGNLTVTGSTTISGSTTFDTDIVPDTDNTGNVGTAALTWAGGQFTNFTVDNTLSVRGAIDLADSDILRFGTGDDWELFHNGTNNYMDLNVGDLIIRDGTTTRFTFGRTTGNLTLTGDLAVNGGDITTSATTFNLLNTTATTVNALGAATTIGIGAPTSATTFGGSVAVGNVLTVISEAYFTDDVSFLGLTTTRNVFNTTATTVNAFGAATTLNLAASTGTTTINNSLSVGGNITVNGSSIVFEGATANANETTLTVTDPTADRTITLPNASGTVAVSVSDTTTTTQGDLNLDFTLSAAGNVSATGDAHGLATTDTPTFAGLNIGSDSLAEYISDTVGAMVTSNTESGISVTYQDADNTLDFDVGDFSITLTGDVTGSGTVTNLGNVSFATTIAANSVALGTDTTGSYVAQGATSGNGISGSVNSEGGTFTVTSNATNANTASTIVFRDASGNFSANQITLAGDIVPDTDNTGNVGTTALTWNSGVFTNLTVDSTLSVRGAIDLADNDDLRFGSSDDYIIDFNATNLVIHRNVGGDILITDTDNSTKFTFAPATGAFTTTGNVTVGGDLTVSGTTTTINTETLNLADNIIVLNSNEAGTPTQNSGIEVERGTATNVVLQWNETSDYWEIASGGTTGRILTTGDEGTGNGLDADTLDGQQGTYYLDWTNVTNKPDPVVTVTLTGDVTGTANTTLTNLGNGTVSVATTIAANSVALGTDTTGSYVAQGATSGNGISGSVNSEGGTFTVTSNATNANTASTIVFRDASGNFSAGTITAALSGNATTASAWATGRTITLTGDVTGTSAAFDGSGNLSFATTIAANSVALGTDTTGSYVAQGATSGNGISGSVNSEGGTFTVTSNATSASTANTIVFRDASANFAANQITIADNIIHAGDTDTYMGFHAVDQWRVVTGGGERFEVTTATTTVQNNLAVNGNTTLGNATTDTITFTARQASDLVPSTTNTRNLGSSSLVYNTVYATLFNGTALEAYYADLAENYEADQAYEPGTVLVFGGEKELTTTNTSNNFRVAGVVSTEPATLMNSKLEGDTVVPLALQGRVPCKVIGRVEKGDMIVTSSVPGYGMVNNQPTMGTVIGKAVGTKTDTDRGWVEVVVGRV